VDKISSETIQVKLLLFCDPSSAPLFGVLGDIYVVLFVGLFFISSPGIYKKGVLTKLFPPKNPKPKKLLMNLASTLTKKWLKGKIFR